MFEKESKKYAEENKEVDWEGFDKNKEDLEKAFKDGAEFGYNKAKKEMQEQDYSLVDFVMKYENGKFKCKYKSGKVFESVDGETWKEIVLP